VARIPQIYPEEVICKDSRSVTLLGHSFAAAAYSSQACASSGVSGTFPAKTEDQRLRWTKLFDHPAVGE